MKKVLLLLALCSAMLAQATTYKYLTFENTQGHKISLSVEGLTLDFCENIVRISNNEHTIGLEIADLAYMYFSGEVTAVDNVLNTDAPIDIYTVMGVSLGGYSSLTEAIDNVLAGTYVITNGYQSQTIVVK